MKSRSKATKQTKKNEGSQAPGRPIDMVPQIPNRHTLRIQEAQGGGYAITHETHKSGAYAEKLHVANNKNHAKEIINKIL